MTTDDAYVLRGIRTGIQRIGFRYHAHSCRSASRNMEWAGQHPLPVQKYLEKELAAGRIVGPLDREVNVHISRLRVIPKPHQPGKWRLITDLSSPEGASVNDGIDPRVCSVNYISVDDAVRAVINLGRWPSSIWRTPIALSLCIRGTGFYSA